jgi:dynein intermediate chain
VRAVVSYLARAHHQAEAELEAKRAKLEELRRAREQRKSAFTAEQRGSEVSVRVLLRSLCSKSIQPASERPPSAARRAQLDELVTSLLSGGSANETPQTGSALSTPALAQGGPSGRTSRLSDVPAPSSDRDGSERESLGNTTLVQPESTTYRCLPSS